MIYSADPATVPFVNNLAVHGDQPALVTAAGVLSYRDLAGRVAEAARRMAGGRRLVLVTGSNTAGALVGYLGALAAGHVVLLTADRPIPGYDPDLLVSGDGDDCRIEPRRTVPAQELHPDLALLLSTSGSTGSAKLVRLSHRNLAANAEAIGTYLEITGADRAITTLPMHYCYGLSVIHSYLARGASLVLTDRSVADPGFWDLVREHRVTSLAGVPYTFELLDRVGFDTMRLPHLRYLTQAGGRLAPDRVRHLAALGRRDGWQLYVMYGQTEATARMAYLPPELAATHPESIGVPIPGGSFRLDPHPDWPDAGELVYAGPNVMMGYAEQPSDLALGPTLAELRTGDIARRTDDGLYEIVGRSGRFLKLFGLRIDLQRIEEMLAARGVTTACTGDDHELIVAVVGTAEVRALIAEFTGLPSRVIRVVPVAELPRLSSGKPDLPAIRDRVTLKSQDLRAAYAEVLGLSSVPATATFVGLGGDSLSYVEMSIRIEQALGHLPAQWHTTPIGELRPAATPRRRTLDTTAALRTIAIVLLVGTHTGLYNLPGGAHLLLGLAGFNFGRFQVTAATRTERARRITRSVGRIAVATVSWVAIAMLLFGDYAAPNLFLANYLVGSDGTHHEWHFWFVETLVYTLVVLLAFLATPVGDRIERRFPFGLPLGLAGLGLVTRYDLVPGLALEKPIANDPATVLAVFWLFALGWATAKATSARQRLLLTAAIVLTVPGFFHYWPREAVVIAGLVLLVWVPAVPSTALVNRVAGLIAGSSLYIYLTQWMVWPRAESAFLLVAPGAHAWAPTVALLAALTGGIAYAAIVGRLAAAVRAAGTVGRLAAVVRGVRLAGRSGRPARGGVPARAGSDRAS